MKKMAKYWRIFLVIVVLIALVCLFDTVADTVGGWFNTSGGAVKTTAKTVAGAGIGLMLLSFGVTALAASVFIGAGLIVIGLALLIYAVWPLFTSPKAE
jgi:hypothetical protein